MPRRSRSKNILKSFKKGIDFSIFCGIIESETRERPLEEQTEVHKRVVRNFDLASDYKPWSGAAKTWEKIVDAGKVEELEGYFEEMYPDGVDSVTAINDDLWFNDEEILDYLGIADEEEDEEEDEEI